MYLKIGIKGKFKDIQGNLIVDSNDKDREVHDLSANVELNSNFRIQHNETGTDLFFKNISVPIYYITDENGCLYYHIWDNEDGLFLIQNEEYEYIIDFSRINFTTNEPENPITFEKYINTTDGYSNITNTPVKENTIYEWRNDFWYEFSSNLEQFRFVTTYRYNELTMDVNFDYPGKTSVTKESISEQISITKIEEAKQKYEDLGYDEQVQLLNGEISGPFEDTLYTQNPISFTYIINNGQGSKIDTPVNPSDTCVEKYVYKYGVEDSNLMYNYENLHLETFTKLRCVLNNSQKSVIQAIQHQTPSNIDYGIGIFLEKIVDARSYYYKNGMFNRYNELKIGR